MRTAKTLIRLGGCPGWSESLLGTHSFCWFCHVVAHIQFNNVDCIVYILNNLPFVFFSIFPMHWYQYYSPCWKQTVLPDPLLCKYSTTRLLPFKSLKSRHCNVSKLTDRQAWANNVDPDQTALRVWLGSTLFAILSASFGFITLW